jgi:two-component system response regulator YesN
MKIIIADDERLVRASVRSMLSELNLPVEIVGEASNGEELVILAAQYLPDAAFVDIRMPKLNGLAGIKAARAVSPLTQWIVLTGFSEFTYAQEALRLQAVNYLLKPVSPDQFREALELVITLRQKQVLAANKEFESDIIGLVHGLSSIADEDGRSILGRAHYETMIFTTDSCLSGQELAARQLEFCRKIREIIHISSVKEIRQALLTLPDGDLGTVCAWNYLSQSDGRKIKESYFSRVGQQAAQMNTQEFSVTMFRSGEYTELTEFLAGLSALSALTPLRVMHGIGCKHLQLDLETSGNRHLISVCKVFVDLAASYRENNYSTYIKSIYTLRKSENQMEQFSAQYQATCSQFIRMAIGFQSREDEQRMVWYKKLEEYGESILKRQVEKKHSETDLVERVVTYVARNYQYDIGISQIAEKLDVTPNYLSMLFHKKTGQPFMKYLTEIRMIRAKELLADPSLQIQEVAEEVGYYSARYFNKVFTQFVGCYPSEYRKKLKI